MPGREQIIEETDTSPPSGFGSYLPRWRPTSSTELAMAEKRVFKSVNTPLKFYNTNTSHGNVWSLQTVNEVSKSKKSVVLLHGMGAGVALWVLNLDHIAEKRKVFALDLLGFGRSSRPTFPTTVAGVEEKYVSSLEEWRKANHLDSIILTGHSFGGYLATVYTIKYPQHVSHLILADPWGFPKLPQQRDPLPLRWRLLVNVIKPFNIFSGLRAAGPFGPRLIDKMRPDLKEKFRDYVKDVESIPNYLYHCNAQDPSGEVAWKSTHKEMGFARQPLIDRIDEVDSEIPITFIYGAQSWMDPTMGYRTQEIREGKAPVTVELILNAGHHVYADNPQEFNTILTNACSMFENNEQHV